MNMVSVMVVEDDVRASYVIENTINKHPDFEVIAVCENITEAHIQAEAFAPELVLVDISLPDGNGLDFIKNLKAKGFNGTFIMTTAEREASIIEKAIQIGVMDYLVKPLRMSRVLQALGDYQDFKTKLGQSNKIDQQGIDALFRKQNQPESGRNTPKGIDEKTLDLLNQFLDGIDDKEFTAEEVGQAINLSRITARRYLEYLETQGLVSMNLNYQTGGRPKQLYIKTARG